MRVFNFRARKIIIFAILNLLGDMATLNTAVIF